MHAVQATKTAGCDHEDPGLVYELRFQAIDSNGRDFSFTCDCRGNVSLDDLSDSDRESYLYARTVIGREVHAPVIVPHAQTVGHSTAMPPDAILASHKDRS